MARSHDYHNAKREAIKWAVTWLHNRAKTMNDPHAASILNAAALHMGLDAKRNTVGNSIDLEQKFERRDIRRL